MCKCKNTNIEKLSIQLKEEIETKEAALTNVNKEQAVIVREKEDLATEVERGKNLKEVISKMSKMITLVFRYYSIVWVRQTF